MFDSIHYIHIIKKKQSNKLKCLANLPWDRKSPESSYKSIEENVRHWVLNWTRDTRVECKFSCLCESTELTLLSMKRFLSFVFTSPCHHHSGGDAPCIKKASSQFYLFWWVSFIESLTCDSLRLNFCCTWCIFMCPVCVKF